MTTADATRIGWQSEAMIAELVRDMEKPMYCLKCQSSEHPRFEKHGSWLTWRCGVCDMLLDSDFEDDEICG